MPKNKRGTGTLSPQVQDVSKNVRRDSLFEEYLSGFGS